MKGPLIALALVFAGCGLLFSSSAVAEDQPVVAVYGQDKILARLEAIEKKEDDISRQLEEIKAELEVVKIRATLKT